MKNLCYTIFHAHLNFSNLNWGNVSSYKLHWIISLQNMAIGAVSKNTDVEFSPQIVEQIHLKQTLLCYFKFLCGSLPIRFLNSLELTSHQHRYLTRNASRPILPGLRIELGLSSLSKSFQTIILFITLLMGVRSSNHLKHTRTSLNYKFVNTFTNTYIIKSFETIN